MLVSVGLVRDHVVTSMQTLSTLDTIYKSAAFRDVIFTSHKPGSREVLDPEPAGSGFVTVRFSVSYEPISFV